MQTGQMTEHGRYGDTPLGKSDEELREEGADALTEDERHRRAGVGSEADVPLAIPLASPGVPGIAVPALINTEMDPETGERHLRSEHD